MVDFRTMRSSLDDNLEIEPRKLFQRLVKPDGVNELYASQGDVLDRWFKQKDVKDCIIKLPTGGGKSLVGLLVAKSTLADTKKPVLYLTPTRQLVDQLCKEAARFGIKAEPYVDSKLEYLPALSTLLPSV